MAKHKRIALLDHRAGTNGSVKALWKRDHGGWTREDQHADLPASVNLEGVGSAKAQLVVPCIVAGGRSVAVLWASFAEMPATLGKEDFKWLEMFAMLCGGCTNSMQEQVRRREEKVVTRIASLIDRELKQGAVKCPGLTIGRRESPAGSALGGDFTTFVVQEGMKRLVVLVGDAESHGLGGALRMLPLVTAFRIIAQESGSPKHIMERLGGIQSLLPDMRATAVCFSVERDRDKALLFASSAGHPPLGILRPDGRFSWCPDEETFGSDQMAEGPMIGSGAALRVGEAYRVLRKGDIILAYTDGIEEAQNERGVKFGRARVSKAMVGAGPDPQGVADAVYEAALQYRKGRLEDDASVLAIRVDLDE